jgi:DNA polymerase delta subunit 1
MQNPRKPPRDYNPKKDALEFMITDWYIPESDKALREIQNYRPERGPFKNSRPWMHYKNELEPNEEDGEETRIKVPNYDIYMFGCTKEGDSVCAKVEGFEPYFFVKLPAALYEGKSKGFVQTKVDAIKMELLEGMVQKRNYHTGEMQQKKIIPFFLKDQLKYVKLVWRKDFWGFTNGESFPFIKIKTGNLMLFQMLRRYFQERSKEGFQLYESNIDPFLRFIHEQNISPCGWVRLDPRTYLLNESGNLSRCGINIQVDAAFVKPLERNYIAPLLIASFDLECTSSHGDFPLAQKDYRKVAQDFVTLVRQPKMPSADEIANYLLRIFKESFVVNRVTLNQVYTKQKPNLKEIETKIKKSIDILMKKLKATRDEKPPNDEEDEDEGDVKPSSYKSPAEYELCAYMNKIFPEVVGDKVIQIGTTFHRYGNDEIIYRHIVSLNSCDTIEGADVESVDSEEELFRTWRDMILRTDPDMLTGYNIFGFDMKYIWDRIRDYESQEFEEEFSMGLGRLVNRRTSIIEQKLASSALGENIMHYIDLDGIVCVDMLKVMQRDHKLDSYKLDFVAQVFLGDNKHDLKPNEIFQKFKGTSEDRCTIAKYCLQDCALCNRMLHKLKVLENNIGMGNVCSVPLSYLFMRGQGVKIFSLVSKECKNKGYVIPVLRGYEPEQEDEEGYEGAIVLPPQEGIYLEEPVTVLDYSSLYPSCMMERNLSHDCYVLPHQEEKYGDLEEKGIKYVTVEYDIYEGVADKKHVVGKKQCKFAQLPEGKKGIIPQILQKLITQRKNTKKKIEYQTLIQKNGIRVSGIVKDKETNYEVLDVETGKTSVVPKDAVQDTTDTYTSFEQAVLDALQLAYKVTANSLYGQIGSRTSPIYLKDIAACTTATGRERIQMAKNFVETRFGARVIYGDTDSIFCVFPNLDENGVPLKGKDALPVAIRSGQAASKAIREILPPPQVLEYEKTMFPFILFSKKRYVGNLYEDDANKKPKQKSMGIALKRRDYAQVVKRIYGGVIDILLNQYDLDASLKFLQDQLNALTSGQIPMEELVITKTLKSTYKDRTKIAHAVLADRMGERDEGNKPQSNDRIPFIYVIPPPDVQVKLQGDRIEHPEYIREHDLIPDYRFYITNQIMKPVCQLYALCVEKLPDYNYPESYWMQVEEHLHTTEIYANNEKKVKDKITQLKMKVVEELLFNRCLNRLTTVKIGKKSNKPVKPLPVKPPIEVLALEIQVSEQKEKKQITKQWNLKDKAGTTLYEKTIQQPKKRIAKLILGLECLESALQTISQDSSVVERIREYGLKMYCEKDIAKAWKKAIEKGRDAIREEMEASAQEADLGAIKEQRQDMLLVGIMEKTNAIQVYFE